jgi:hypothetical protein
MLPDAASRHVSERYSRLSTRFSQFFPDDSPDSVCAQALSRSTKMLPQRFIDHRLVAPALDVGALSERVEHVVVDVDRDAGLSALASHRTALAVREVVFLFHIAVSQPLLRRVPK